MKTFLNIAIFLLCTFCLSCNKREKNNYADEDLEWLEESVSTDSAVRTKPDTTLADTLESSTPSLNQSGRQVSTSNSRTNAETGFDSESREQGLYDGLTHGADDAISGNSKHYNYLGSSPPYREGYREGYDQAYASGDRVTPEHEDEYEELVEEYGLDEIEDYSDIDFTEYE